MFRVKVWGFKIFKGSVRYGQFSSLRSIFDIYISVMVWCLGFRSAF